MPSAHHTGALQTCNKNTISANFRIFYFVLLFLLFTGRVVICFVSTFAYSKISHFIIYCIIYITKFDILAYKCVCMCLWLRQSAWWQKKVINLMRNKRKKCDDIIFITSPETTTTNNINTSKPNKTNNNYKHICALFLFNIYANIHASTYGMKMAKATQESDEGALRMVCAVAQRYTSCR